MSERSPRLIGYWSHLNTTSPNGYPHPATLVRADWLDKASLAALLHYLRSVPNISIFEAYVGFSWCRFQCGVEKSVMGSREYFDGSWVWPEGLAHYVERHSVFLPDEFVERAISGIVPVPRALPSERDIDFEYWIDWARQHATTSHEDVV